MQNHSTAMNSSTASSLGLSAYCLAKYRPALTRFFRRRLRYANDVEDLVQEVFLRLAARRGPEVENIGGYLFQTSASVLADRHRRRQVRHADDQIPYDGDLHGETDFDASRVIEARQALHAASLALEALPERTQKIFAMRRIEGQSYKEIASCFGVSISTIEKRMADAVKQLQATSGCVQSSALLN